MLGQPARRVLTRFGSPSDVVTVDREVRIVFSRHGIIVHVVEGLIQAVSTTNSLLRTPEGIGPGSGVAKVREAYGEPSSTETVEGISTLAYDRLGVAFGVDRGIVVLVRVFPAR